MRTSCSGCPLLLTALSLSCAPPAARRAPRSHLAPERVSGRTAPPRSEPGLPGTRLTSKAAARRAAKPAAAARVTPADGFPFTWPGSRPGWALPNIRRARTSLSRLPPCDHDHRAHHARPGRSFLAIFLNVERTKSPASANRPQPAAIAASRSSSGTRIIARVGAGAQLRAGSSTSSTAAAGEPTPQGVRGDQNPAI